MIALTICERRIVNTLIAAHPARLTLREIAHRSHVGLDTARKRRIWDKLEAAGIAEAIRADDNAGHPRYLYKAVDAFVMAQDNARN